MVLYLKVPCLEGTRALEEVLCCEVQCIIGSLFCEQKDRQTDRTEKITLSQHRCREVMTPQQFYIKPRDFLVNFHRLQLSCRKVMFSQAYVKNSVHRGVDVHPLRQTPPSPGRYLPRQTSPSQTSPGTHPQTDTPLQIPLRQNPPRTATAADGTHPTGTHSWYRILLGPPLWILKKFSN